MSNTFKVNGKEIIGAEITFGTVRKMTKLGVDFNNITADLPGLVSAYVTVSTHASQDTVDRELQAHIVNGGNFDEILDAFQNEMDESDFFQALAKTDKTETE